MPQNTNKKVCLIVDCLTGGGAERTAAKLSIKLSDLGYQVSIISVRDEVTYHFKGKLFNLGERDSKIKPLKQFVKLFRFKKAYKEASADIYIDFRMRDRRLMEWLLHKFVFDIRKMAMAIRSYNIDYHMPKSTFFYNQYAKSKAILVVSKQITHRMLNFPNLVYIPNFYSKNSMPTDSIKRVMNTTPFILAVGRLDNAVKQFDKLILSYKNSKLLTEGLKLLIIGEGKDRKYLENLIEENNLTENVKLLGFIDNPFEYLANAKFLILCSKFEGFPNAILESLGIGTPVVAFNCKSGPSEMVVNEYNGILVEDQNFEALKTAMNTMVSNQKLYEYCKSNTKKSVEKFSEETIIKKWVQLIEA
ncbi:MAG: glycosyltransferase [Jejuia sp.]